MVLAMKKKGGRGSKTKTAVVKPIKISNKLEEIEEELLKPIKKGKIVKPKPVKEECSKEEPEEEEEIEDDEEEDDDEEEEEEMEEFADDDNEEEETKPKVGDKRKMAAKSQDPSKKAKSTNTVTVVFRSICKTTYQTDVNEFLGDKELDVVACRVPNTISHAFVDISEDNLPQALALDKSEWKGHTIGVHLDKNKNAKQKRQSFGKTDSSNRMTLFCKNVPYEASEENIGALFNGVKQVRIVRNKDTGSSKGICFVEFESEDLKNAAYENKNDYLLKNRKLFLEVYEGHKLSQSPLHRDISRCWEGDSSNRMTLFCKNVPYEASEENIGALFNGVKQVRIVRNKDTGSPRGYCFVEFESEDLKNTAYENKNDYSLNNRKLYLSVYEGDKLSQSPHRRDIGRCWGGDEASEVSEGFSKDVKKSTLKDSSNRMTLFCKNVPYEASEENIGALFNGVKQVRIVRNKDTGSSKGFCYIEFKSEDFKNAALQNKDGFELNNRKLVLDVLGSQGGGVQC